VGNIGWRFLGIERRIKTILIMFYCTALFIIRHNQSSSKATSVLQGITSRFRSNNKIETSVCTLFDLIHFSERLNVKKLYKLRVSQENLLCFTNVTMTENELTGLYSLHTQIHTI
jgi:hypothetical protein